VLIESNKENTWLQLLFFTDIIINVCFCDGSLKGVGIYLLFGDYSYT